MSFASSKSDLSLPPFTDGNDVHLGIRFYLASIDRHDPGIPSSRLLLLHHIANSTRRAQ